MKTFDECFKEHVEDEVMSWDVEHSSIAAAFWRECTANYAPLVEAVADLVEDDTNVFSGKQYLAKALKAVRGGA